MAMLFQTLGVVGLAVLSWGVLLAAVASLHSLFSDAIDSNGLSEVLDDWLADQLGLTWWMVWYQFALIVAVAASAAMGRLKQHSQVLLTVLAALLALQMFETHDAAVLNRASEGSVKKLRDRSAVFLAGTIMSAASTVFLIIWIGSLPASDSTVTAANLASLPKDGYPAEPSMEAQSSGVQQYVAEATGSTAVRDTSVNMAT